MTRSDADQVLGHLQRHQTNEGTKLRLHRRLAHSLTDELYEPRESIEPTTFTRRDLIEIVVGVPLLASLMFGIPFLLWLVAA